MKLLYHPRSLKFLKKIPLKETRSIIHTIESLSAIPTPGNLDVKKLVNTKRSYRLRIKNIRVIYEIDQKEKILYVHDIDFRGNIY